MMDNWAIDQLIGWAAGKGETEKTKAALTGEIGELIAELAGSNPSPIERVLAESAATSWFAYRLHEAQYALSVCGEDGISLAQSEHAQRRIDRAHRRYLSTLKTLATVRRLAVPALQINLARHQVNQIKMGAHNENA
jgi:phenylpyruvate tautomerase PptA (4-oxalocrotonate tautomerase family)